MQKKFPKANYNKISRYGYLTLRVSLWNLQENWCGELFWACGNNFGAKTSVCRFFWPHLLNWPYFNLHRKIAFLRWGWVFLKRTRFLSGIQFKTHFIEYFCCGNTTIRLGLCTFWVFAKTEALRNAKFWFFLLNESWVRVLWLHRPVL